MSVFDELVKYAEWDPDSMVLDVLREDWYNIMPDTDQAQFWVMVLTAVVGRFGKEDVYDLSEVLEGALPKAVLGMVAADLRSARFKK